MYALMGTRKSGPPQNRQLNVSSVIVNNELTLSWGSWRSGNQLMNTFCEISFLAALGAPPRLEHLRPASEQNTCLFTHFSLFSLIHLVFYCFIYHSILIYSFVHQIFLNLCLITYVFSSFWIYFNQRDWYFIAIEPAPAPLMPYTLC